MCCQPTRREDKNPRHEDEEDRTKTHEEIKRRLLRQKHRAPHVSGGQRLHKIRAPVMSGGIGYGAPDGAFKKHVAQDFSNQHLATLVCNGYGESYIALREGCSKDGTSHKALAMSDVSPVKEHWSGHCSNSRF
jgi:hypothetical protein